MKPMMLLCPILATVACQSTEGSAVARPTALAAPSGLGCSRVGVLLPDDDRFTTVDGPMLAQKIQAVTGNPVDLVFGGGPNGAPVDYEALSGIEHAQAMAMIDRGACILVMTSSRPDRARATVLLAAARGVPVIAYDRLIQAPELSYYVGFDNRNVGRLQGKYIVDHHEEYAKCTDGDAHNLALFHGDEADFNAQLFRAGAMEELQPLIDDGTLNPVYDAFTPFWDFYAAGDAFFGLLDTLANDLQVVYSANDDMAGSFISVMTQRGLNGRVLVTGQDATPAGIVNIILGNQAMTVAKSPERLAQATADLIAAMRASADVTALTHGATAETRSGKSVPSVLVPVTSVDRCNVRDVVLSWLPQDVCAIWPGLCDELQVGPNLCPPAPACPTPGDELCEPRPVCPAPTEPPEIDPLNYGLDTCWFETCLHNCRTYPKAPAETLTPDGHRLLAPKADLYCLRNDDEDGDRHLVMAIQRRPSNAALIDFEGEEVWSRAVPPSEEVTLTVEGPAIEAEDGYCYRTISQVALGNGYAARVDVGPFTCHPL